MHINAASRNHSRKSLLTCCCPDTAEERNLSAGKGKRQQEGRIDRAVLSYTRPEQFGLFLPKLPLSKTALPSVSLAMTLS